LALVGLLAFSLPVTAYGSGSGNGSSNSSESNNSNSSNGSNDSSNSSKGSSDNSHASSKDSDNSTQNSPKNSADYSTKGTTNWSTNSHGAHVFSIVMAVVAVGATVVGLIAVNHTRRADQQRTTTALATFMRTQHALLTHDVAMAGGPVLDAWAHDLRLDANEREHLRRVLEGSREQGLLLDALDGSIDAARAQQFAAAFLRITERTLGRARTRALVERAARATGLA
jgi:hypothetical protein